MIEHMDSTANLIFFILDLYSVKFPIIPHFRIDSHSYTYSVDILGIVEDNFCINFGY